MNSYRFDGNSGDGEKDQIIALRGSKSEAGSYYVLYGFTVAISVVLGLPMDVELHAHTELKLRHRRIQICIVCL